MLRLCDIASDSRRLVDVCTSLFRREETPDTFFRDADANTETWCRSALASASWLPMRCWARVN
eukprot:scaffold1611_cov307-Pinguiococcus_pyrenoidosus.AAC.2